MKNCYAVGPADQRATVRVRTYHLTEEQAEQRITEIEKVDPDGVYQGYYYLDEPDETDEPLVTA